MAGALAARTLARPSFETAFAAPAFGRAMLAFEAALAHAQAEEGLIPGTAARAIEGACASIALDEERLVAEGKRSATLAVPLVDMLRAEISKTAPELARHAHLGATSQDVLDTAMALCLKSCLEEADRSLEGAVRGLARKARDHAQTPMLGRTLMQAALPITAGLKIGHWALALAHDRDRLAEAAAAGLAVQLGGPVGALESMGATGTAVRHRVATRLGLADAHVWHVHRNAWIDLLDRIGQVVITAGKIALDVSLMQQPEVGEMLEAPPRAGVGASSSMPHKRNPVGCVHALAAATRMPGLLSTVHAAALAQHERALGGWQAELAVVPEIAGQLGSCLDFLDGIAESLVVDAERMRANLRQYSATAMGGPPLHACDEVLAALSPYL